MTQNVKPVVVFGARGLLGSRVVDRLRASGHPVRAVYHAREKPDPTPIDGVEWVHADMLDPVTLPPVLEGAAAVITTANGFMQDGRSGGVDVDGNRHLIEACVRHGIARFIFISASTADDASPVDFFRWKAGTERTLAASSLDYTILRPSKFMEMWAKMIADPIASDRRAIVFGSGRAAENYVSVVDVAGFVAQTLDDPTAHRTFDIRGPADFSANQIVDACEARFDKHARVTRVPVPVLRVAALLSKRVNPVISRMTQAAALSYADDARPTGVPMLVGSTGMLDVIAGFAP